MITKQLFYRIRTITAISLFLLGYTAANGVIAAEKIVLKDKHPTEYTIRKGDTLWDISSRFLRDPWRWPDIWYVNPQINNPHLIYPGDEVVLTYKDGRPQLELKRKGSAPRIKLAPEIRSNPIKRAIPTIPLDAIAQFLTQPTVLQKKEIKQMPYVVSSRDQHLIAGTGNTIYARGLPDNGVTRYTIVRPGNEIRDSKRNKRKLLGYEAGYVAEAILRKTGDPSSLEITRATRETLVGDRLIPTDVQNLEYHFQPHAPKKDIKGQIIQIVNGIKHVGQYQIVIVNRGTEHGIEKGHVLAVDQVGLAFRDSIKGKRIDLPAERAGYLMVFRPFQKLSYALVMKSSRDMRLYDYVKTP